MRSCSQTIPKQSQSRSQTIPKSSNMLDSVRQKTPSQAPEFKRPLTRLRANVVRKKNETEQREEEREKRKRETIWYNPPYNCDVATNIGKEFLGLIEKHFPKQHKLRQCVNRNCVKLSYSCTKNVKSIIQTHNKKVTTNSNAQTTENRCNCRTRDCPLNGECNSGPIVYRASVKDQQGKTHTYIGSTNNFKDRYRNHTKSFRHIQYSTETTLSNFVWRNDLGPEPQILWEVAKRAQPYKKGNRYCDLCLTEKLMIDREIKRTKFCLNKRSDLTNRCVHRALFRLTRA